MDETSRRKRAYHHFSDHNLTLAVAAIRNGMSYRKAEMKYGVPKSTIQRKVRNIQQNPYGRPTVINSVEETQLSECLCLCAEWGFPLTHHDLKHIVKRYLERKGVNEPRFVNNMPGKNWVKGFLKRQSNEIKTRLSQNIKRARAAITPEIINSYFDELTQSLADVPKEAIINYDETGMQDNPGKNKVIVRRNCKYPERIIDSSKSNFTVMFAGSANGECLPPYVVYKAENMYDTWTQGGPQGTRYNKSKSGWFEGNIFEDWFCTIVLPYLMKLGDCPKAVIGDNLASHISIKILDLCVKNNIKFILLPPNSTHLCQPLDLAYFSPLKTIWRRQLTDWKSKYRGCIRKDQFPRLLKNTLNELKGTSSQNLIAGFQKGGISPLNKNKILEQLPQTSHENQASTSGTSWTASFEDYLKNTREKETKTQPRKKKIEIVPGRSISEKNIIEDLERFRGENKQGKKQNKQQKSKSRKNKYNKENISIDDNDTSEESFVISLHDSSALDEEEFMNITNDFEDENVDDLQHDFEFVPSQYQNNQVIENNYKSNNQEDILNNDIAEDILNNATLEDILYIDVQGHKPNIDNEEEIINNDVQGDLLNIDIQTKIKDFNYTENDFVYVEFVYDQGKKYEKLKYFVGKILSINENYTINFMRNYKGQPNIYVFPQVEDIAIVQYENIKRKLEPISECRGRFTFNL